MVIQFKKLFYDVVMPAYATIGSAGFDLVAHNFKIYYETSNRLGINPNMKTGQGEKIKDGLWAVPVSREIPEKYWGKQIKCSNFEWEEEINQVSMFPKSRLLIGTGFAVAIPKGYMMDIRPRSGNALKQGLTVLNTPGTIDSDYRGEIGVILYNSSNDVVVLKKGDKIAQGIITEYIVATFVEVKELDITERGEGGFGSTDKEYIQKFDKSSHDNNSIVI